MKNEFIRKVVNNGCVYTRKYCYCTQVRNCLNSQWLEVIRIERELVGTTAALDDANWMLIRVVRAA